MPDKMNGGQSGGVNIIGSVGSVGGDITGRDKITGAPTSAEIDEALHPLSNAIEAAPDEARLEADSKLTALKQEVAKGKDANDRLIADLIDGLVRLVPRAVSAIVSAFGTPILGESPGQ